MHSSQAGLAAHGHSSLGRVNQLDALRGLAAATVIYHHWWLALHPGPPPWFLFPFLAGHEAVVLFFVLSGYVLSLPVWRGRQLPYPQYLVRRIARIYVPFLVALALATVGFFLFGKAHLPLTPFYYKTWQTPFSLSLLGRQILMSTDPAMNTAFWSLRYEMEMSLIFPFLCALMAKFPRHTGILLAVAVRLLERLYAHTPYAQGDVVMALYYATFFIVGAALAQERHLLSRAIATASRPVLYLLFLLSIVLYCNVALIHTVATTSDSITILGVAGFILLVQDPRLHLGLNTTLPQYLGRISYSTYLVHSTVLFTMLNLFYGKIPTTALALFYGVVTLALSHLFCITVEEPAMIYGKKLANRLRQPQIVLS